MSDSGEHAGAELRAFLAERDVACPNCGYSLRGLKDAACPECGVALTLSVALQQPITTAWLACMLPLWVVGGGFGVGGCVAWLAFAKDIVRSGQRGEPSVAFWIGVYPLGVAVLFLPPAVFLVLRHGRVWMSRHDDRRGLVVSSFVLCAIATLTWVVWLLSAVN